MVPVLINTMTASFIYGNMSERIDDLEINGFKIIQDTALFCYGMDAVLLSAFANASKKNKCLLNFRSHVQILQKEIWN